ncbi:MAG: nucleotide exchange factor GrpE [Candidatus Absconditicoccaceae bacterium]
MSKKQHDDKQNDELQKKLEEIIQQKSDLENTDQSLIQDQDSDEVKSLKLQIIQLEKEKQELTEMAKRAQYDYINLKMDFDRFIRQTDEKSKTINLDSLISVVKKFLPFLEDLRKSLENITSEHLQDPLTKGVQIVYDNFIKTLESMNIYPIVSIGETPDGLYHEPISMLPSQDPDMKGKIIQEFERGFYYKKDGEVKVITTSKVVIGS